MSVMTSLWRFLFPCFRSVLSLAFFNLWLLITFTINWTSIRLFLLLKQRRYPLHKTSQHNILVELRRLASEYLSSLEIIINLLWNVKLFSPVWKRCFKSDTRFPFNDFGGQKCVCADGDTFKVWRKYIQKQKQQQFKTSSNTSYYWYGSHFVRISRYGCSPFFFSAQLGLLKDKAILRTRRQRVFKIEKSHLSWISTWLSSKIIHDLIDLGWYPINADTTFFLILKRDKYFIHFCFRE